jgi:hypothetical protein
MATLGGPTYNNISEIKGPSGFYQVIVNSKPIIVYVDQTYDGGGWICVLANRKNTAGMNNLKYVDATDTINYRTGGTPNGTNTIYTPNHFIGGLDDYNIWIGLSYWQSLAGRVTSNKITVVQFVSTTNGTQLGSTASHTKRYRWRFDSFNLTYAMVGAASLSDETGTGSPGFYSYHAANGYSLSTYDKDQDVSGGNCSLSYNNNPWWYGACWSGNYFAGGGHQDGPYWDSSGTDYHQYGAVYIK